MSNKIGVGIVTCNRQDFFEKCINSIPDIDTLVVVNDGKPYPDSAYPSKVKEVIQHPTNKCVGVSKNQALRYLIQDGCDYLFLIEDDMIIKNPEVFNVYINTGKTTGLGRLSFGYHGPANKINGVPSARTIIEYPNNIKIALNRHSVGSFCYYAKGIVKNIGYIDEKYQNCWEHIDHDVMAIKAGFLPAYWWWPDVADSYEYIDELACSEVNSVIRKTQEWHKNMQMGAMWFKHKHEFLPTQVPDVTLNEVKEELKKIYNNFAVK